jgi:hypothetical protein
VRCAYVDLDGTLLGRGASLVHDGEGATSLLGVRAIEACLRADVEVVLMSGRRRAQVNEDARLLGQRAYVFECGSGLMLDGELHWLTGSFQPSDQGGTIFEQIERSGAPALLLEHYSGRLEYHDPWHADREVSHLFRGLVDSAEADALLAENGFGDLRLVDNGVVSRRSPALAGLPHVRGYHLIPAVASKAGGVAAHMRARGYARNDAVAVGDSREDLDCAAHVGAFWLVSNGLERDPSIAEALRRYDNARVAEAGYGAGVYEAVVTTLAQAR